MKSRCLIKNNSIPLIALLVIVFWQLKRVVLTDSSQITKFSTFEWSTVCDHMYESNNMYLYDEKKIKK